MAANPRISGLLGWGWLAACLGALSWAQAVALGPAERAYAWPLSAPVPAVAGSLASWAAVWSAIAAILLWQGSAWARARGVAAPWARLLLVHPLLLAGIWLVWPASGLAGLGPGGLAILSLVVGGLAAHLVREWRRGRLDFGPRPGIADFARDAVLLAVLLAGGLIVGGDSDGRSLLQGVLLYPLYALVQLTVFLALPAGDLRRLGAGPASIRIMCAVVFALAHWPNPLVTGLTLIAMVFWAGDFLRGRGLVSIAVSMGVLATVLGQAYPDAWTDHLRVGPGYVRGAAREDLARGDLWFAPANSAWEEEDPRPLPFLQALYPGVVGRPLGPDEERAWTAALDRARRRNILWQFMIGQEYRDEPRLGPPPHPDGRAPGDRRHWRPIVARMSADPYWESAGGTWDGFLTAVYRDFLGRSPAPAELAAWPSGLNLIQRRQVAEVLLGNAGRWAHATADPGAAALVAPPVPILQVR
ncbi:hypothetical protein KJ682_04370 [bacterium]|nr:hypothetical protein [bacterium]